jgi:SOS response associated peptidase (SRAP)/ATP dependent DNA ligase domain
MSDKRDCDLCLWCFDLLALDGERLTEKPLANRRALLHELVNVADDHAVQFSMAFDGDTDLLTVAERMGLEGIVSKRKDSFYRSGPTRDWLKAKTATLRASNCDRWENWKRPGSEVRVRTFAIITTNSNELVGTIHDRMPVIIGPEDYTRWLSSLDPDPRDLLVLYPAELMTMWPISTRVNKPVNDDASSWTA